MSTTEVRRDESAAAAGVATVDMKLEVIVIPVSDVDRAMAFYQGLGWRLDGDFRGGDHFRGIQFTPPGSACSIQFGTNVTSAAPGSAQGLHLVVGDIEAAHADLVARGVPNSGVYHCQEGYACRFPGNDPPVPGPHPDRGTYGSFLDFTDPDGNGWVLQEVTTRFPGRVEGETTYASADDLSQALRRAAAAHGEHEARTGQADPDWPQWYAEFMRREQTGEQPPS
ncbi:Catechol 2,3-dioxygenase [Geodermatophilus telluris]|uniref:Catechol 2,3-dioxygenase n=1 Tax=Geodermatophilus telluris TaxID=1190417 RepID=A0A1G6TI85_9ACTN|nr:VOC family protein [Geodermatophilus telluris]SDD28798.1 Catechol 2,3-dioxygenase [Geodermatophilus telluris]